MSYEEAVKKFGSDVLTDNGLTDELERWASVACVVLAGVAKEGGPSAKPAELTLQKAPLHILLASLAVQQDAQSRLNS